MTTGRLVDIIGATARERRLFIRADCGGSVRCCAEIHIEGTTPPFKCQEIHLTREEVEQIRDALTLAMYQYDYREV